MVAQRDGTTTSEVSQGAALELLIKRRLRTWCLSLHQMRGRVPLLPQGQTNLLVKELVISGRGAEMTVMVAMGVMAACIPTRRRQTFLAAQGGLLAAAPLAPMCTPLKAAPEAELDTLAAAGVDGRIALTLLAARHFLETLLVS